MAARLAIFLLLIVAVAVPASAQAAGVSKSYSYFTIRGRTLDEIQAQLDRLGPKLSSTGQRHPGLTHMEFKSHVGYREQGGRCEVTDVKVTLRAKVILPRWSQRGAPADVKFVWDTLASDIKRHEEAHVVIARNYASELESELRKIRPQRNCDLAKNTVQQATARILSRHDAEQDRFDAIEGRNFESRLGRLLDYRLEQASRR